MNNLKLYEQIIALKDYLESNTEQTPNQIEQAMKVVHLLWAKLERRAK